MIYAVRRKVLFSLTFGLSLFVAILILTVQAGATYETEFHFYGGPIPLILGEWGWPILIGPDLNCSESSVFEGMSMFQAYALPPPQEAATRFT